MSQDMNQDTHPHPPDAAANGQGPPAAASGAVAQLLAMTARDADAWVAEARSEAAALVDDARAEAEAVLSSARAEAERLRAEADATRRRQAAEVAELRRAAAEQRERLRRHLSDLLGHVDGPATPEPADA
jgi:vacuolar-type H+-ATPase subunit H